MLSAAHAADFQERVAPGPYDWTGAYAGVFAGVATGDFDYEAGAVGGPVALGLGVSGGGMFGGAQVGYDWQTGSWVLGAVADIALSGQEAELSANLVGLGTVSAESQLKYLGTVRGRAGYAFDRALVYGHGGFAYGRTEQEIAALGTSVFENDTSKSGWVIGAGFEYAITDAVSFQTEYGYYDLGSDEVYNDGTIQVSEDLSFHSIKAGVNFRF